MGVRKYFKLPETFWVFLLLHKALLVSITA